MPTPAEKTSPSYFDCLFWTDEQFMLTTEIAQVPQPYWLPKRYSVQVVSLSQLQILQLITLFYNRSLVILFIRALFDQLQPISSNMTYLIPIKSTAIKTELEGYNPKA